ncbi:hypothetical protein WN944_013229 [Citrus x changshan-huyou]|uniref:Uncharacterized protein n=1 Tax=Citrus x changshan-huyou TaxID=2935761 RepID=A0AAP0M3F6_9ROSI
MDMTNFYTIFSSTLTTSRTEALQKKHLKQFRDVDLCSHDRTDGNTTQTVHLLHLHNRCSTCQKRGMGFQDCCAKTGREARVKRRKRFVNEREEGFLLRGKTKRKTKCWVLVAFAFFSKPNGVVLQRIKT